MAFNPNHRSPAAGLDAYAEHDVAGGVAARIEPDLPLEVAERWGDWARITCSNGWQAWVDGRHLVAAAGPPTVTVQVPQPGGPPPIVAAAPAATGGAKTQFVLSQAMVGAGLIAVGAVLPWFRGEGVDKENAFGIPVKFLLDYKKPGDSGFSVGLLLLVAAAAGVAGLTVWAKEQKARQIAGFGAAALVTVFLARWMQLIGEINKGDGKDVGAFSFLNIGLFVAVAGGVALAVASTAPLGKPKT